MINVETTKTRKTGLYQLQSMCTIPVLLLELVTFLAPLILLDAMCAFLKTVALSRGKERQM